VVYYYAKPRPFDAPHEGHDRPRIDRTSSDQAPGLMTIRKGVALRRMDCCSDDVLGRLEEDFTRFIRINSLGRVSLHVYGDVSLGRQSTSEVRRALMESGRLQDEGCLPFDKSWSTPVTDHTYDSSLI